MSIEGFRKIYFDASSRTVISPELLKDGIRSLQEKHGGSRITALAHRFIEEGEEGSHSGADQRANLGARLFGRTIIAIEQLIVEGVFDFNPLMEGIYAKKSRIKTARISLLEQHEMLLAAHNDPTLCCFLEKPALFLPERVYLFLKNTRIPFSDPNNPIKAEEIFFMDFVQTQIPTFKALARAVLSLIHI